MRGNELLDKMELIDPAYIEAADAAPNKPFLKAVDLISSGRNILSPPYIIL